jgi:hypothetical protein
LLFLKKVAVQTLNKVWGSATIFAGDVAGEDGDGERVDELS